MGSERVLHIPLNRCPLASAVTEVGLLNVDSRAELLVHCAPGLFPALPQMTSLPMASPESHFFNASVSCMFSLGDGLGANMCPSSPILYSPFEPQCAGPSAVLCHLLLPLQCHLKVGHGSHLAEPALPYLSTYMPALYFVLEENGRPASGTEVSPSPVLCQTFRYQRLPAAPCLLLWVPPVHLRGMPSKFMAVMPSHLVLRYYAVHW
jgi:hypothetical protein